jgi:hypothetical protein
MNPQPPTFARFNPSDRPTATIRSASDFARVHVARRPALRALIACVLACLLSVGASASGVARKAAPRARGATPPAAKAAGTTARGDDKAAAAQPSPTQTPTPSPSPIEIESYEASPYPADDGMKKYALVVKRKDGDGSFFGTDPSLISLSLTPAGAADITIRRVTPTRIEADFRAPDNYKVNDLGVTVYNAGDRQLVVASSDVKKKPAVGAGQDTAENDQDTRPKPGAEDEQQPQITSTAVIFLQRAYGIGRLKIEGKNFGTYEAPPISAENYLLCFEPLARQALIDALGGLPDNTRNVRMKLDQERCDNLRNDESKDAWDKWRAKVEPLIKVALVPRNTDLRIEQTKVLYADDKLIDVYFEFNRYYKYSEPLRLASTTVTVQKPVVQTPEKKPQAAGGQSQTAAARGLDGASVINAVVSGGTGADDVKPSARPPLSSRDDKKTFIATREVGTKQDENLEYRYTVLDTASAKTLFGSGVANNFYAIQLSVTNKGDKKVAIPLASIQAEIEWAEGLASEDDAESANLVKASANAKVSNAPPPMPKKNSEAAKQKGGYIYFEEGPATLAPLPLSAVTAFFTGDEKAKGPKAHLFNAFDGAATLGSSLIPFFGPGFRDAHVAFTGGFVPGFHKFIGDLSGEQLENLTANSWQSVEVVAAKGGSVDKFVFIQRGDQDFAVGIGEKIRKRIKDIEGIEVVGFEVIESEAKRATLAGEQ